MLLLAEAYAVGGDEMIDLALETFSKLIELNENKPQQCVDYYKMMAPLCSQKQDFEQAIVYQRKALELENDKLQQIQLLTKIAGNHKKADDKEGTIYATNEAYKLCKDSLGENDIMTAKCLINLANVYVHFKMHQEAKDIFCKYLEGW